MSWTLMLGFLIGVLSSLTAATLFLVVSKLWPPRFRRWLSVQLSRLSGGAFGESWPNRQSSADDLARELARAKWVQVLTGRGSELQRATFEGFLSKKTAATRSFKLLLPDTEDERGRYWISKREEEVGKFDHSYADGLLSRQIAMTVDFMNHQLESGVVDLRTYCYPHVGRTMVTDRVAYFSPYSDDRHGRDDPILKFSVGTPMYESLARTFRLLWEAGSPPMETSSTDAS